MATAMSKSTMFAPSTIGAVHLTVSDLQRSSTFYGEVLGLRPRPQADGTVEFGATDAGPALLVLHGDAKVPLERRAPGLYHFALLMPTRRALAAALARIASARWPLVGASDHLVSEAIYLEDPDGIGIEIYRDRAREEWPSDGAGGVQMATLALDLNELLGELTEDPRTPNRDHVVPATTTIGHVHLQVSSLAESERFYTDALGLDVTQRGYPGALFFSANGYHHHIGLNVWHSRGGQRATAGAVGLRGFEIRMADREALEAVVERVRAAGLPVDESPLFDETGGDGVVVVEDPSGNRVLLRA